MNKKLLCRIGNNGQSEDNGKLAEWREVANHSSDQELISEHKGAQAYSF